MASETRNIILNGLWKQNPGVVQILGMCPTLAVSTTLVNGLSLGLATTLVMALANTAAATLKSLVPQAVRIPAYILIIATLVTMVDLLMHAYVLPLYKVLGIFIPLIVVNCIVLARVEAFASKNGVFHSFLDGLMMGLGLSLVLAFLGAIREIFGKGLLLSGLNLAFGPAAKAYIIHVIPHYHGLLLAVLPPGAFIGLGLLIAIRNWIEYLRAQPVRTAEPLPQEAV